MSYVTYEEFVDGPYGIDFAPTGSVFQTSGAVEEFLSFVSSLIDLYCGRKFDVNRFEEIVEGNDKDVIYLNSIPVTGIVSIEYSSYSGSTGSIEPVRVVLFKKIGKVKYPSKFSSDKYYTITYDAGYETIPEPIKMATLMWANIIAQGIENGAVATPDGGSMAEFRVGKIWEQYIDPRHRTLQGNVPASVKMILDKYKYMKM